MKILIVGASGQLAQSLLESGNSSKNQLVALGSPDLDVTDANSVRAAFDLVRPDITINAAAYAAVDAAEENIDLAYAVNREGPRKLAENCARLDIPLIHCSTDYVYDGSSPRAYVEDDPIAPLGVYGTSKAEGDAAVQSTTAKHIILRTAWVYSPFGRNFVKTMMNLASTKDELNVVDDQCGSPTYAPHMADAMLSIIENITDPGVIEKPWGVYNLAGSGDATWFEFACQILDDLQELGGPEVRVTGISTEQYPTPARRPKNSRLDCRKLKDVFGIEIPHWRKGTSQCVERLWQLEQI